MALRALEFYSGIGGLHRSLHRSNINAVVVGAYDWDQNACRVYEANCGAGQAHKTDISSLNASDLTQLDASVWLLSPACQPYTVLNPAAKGAADPRAKSFLHLIDGVIPELARLHAAPRWILVENVAGFETSTTRTTLVETLKAHNYTVIELLLTPLQFGIPNSRLRYYLLAKAKPLKFANTVDIHGANVGPFIWRHIPGHGNPWIDERDDATVSVAEVRSYLDDAEEHERQIPERVLLKWGRLFDIVLPGSRRTCCFTRGYTQLVERSGSILQTNETLDTTRTFDDFFAAKAGVQAGSHEEMQALDILRPLRLRYFSPSELLRLFHFTRRNCDLQGDEFIWPPGITERTQYRLLGNSVNVEVVKYLIEYLFEEDNLHT